MLERGFWIKIHNPVILTIASEIFEKFVNKKLLQYCLFSDFQFGFRVSRLTVGLLTVAAGSSDTSTCEGF